jgi:multidrug transporter EmrE-like cation transporter
MFLVFLPTPLLVARIAQIVGAPVSVSALAVTIALLAILFLLPAIRRTGLKVSYATWNRAGLAAAALYMLAALYAHSVALARLREFAAFKHIEAQSLGALPFPPSIWHWDGLIRMSRGVYEMRMDLSEKPSLSEAPSSDPRGLPPIEYHFYPDAFPNSCIEQARQLPAVQKVLWFSRFPVTRFHKEGDDGVVEISDLRFAPIRPGRPAAFTYRVRFGPDGSVLSEGWVKN